MESKARDCSSCRDSQVRSSLLFTEKLLSDHFQFFDFVLRQYKLFLTVIYSPVGIYSANEWGRYSTTPHLGFCGVDHLRRNSHSNCKCCATIGDKIVETLYSNRVTSERKIIYPPHPLPSIQSWRGVFVVFYR